MISPRPHLFLDRDGTIIREEHYLSDPGKVALESGVAEALQRFSAAGYLLVVVSNQSGVGRGLISEDDVAVVNARVAELLAAQCVSVSSWHHCPHRPEDGCTCRKPGLSLFEAADALHTVDWHQSFMVGDKASDVQAGLSLGMKAALITTGYGLRHIDWAISQGVPVFCSLVEFVEWALPVSPDIWLE
jgi:D-glycero-D-manno-heptose 1,7-bisphosphate phosphatase